MRISKFVALGALAAVGVAGAPKADAAYIAYLYQDGSNVVATGSGSIDLAALSYYGTDATMSGVASSAGVIVLGPAASTAFDGYAGFSGPTSFGSISTIFATSGSGPLVGVSNFSSLLVVPAGYVSETSLGTSGATWDNTTLAALGVTDGTYTWTWGSGADADSFTLNIGEAPPVATPEPASLALLGTGLAALGLNRRRRRKGA